MDSDESEEAEIRSDAPSLYQSAFSVNFHEGEAPVAPPGQSSLLGALFKLNEQWSGEISRPDTKDSAPTSPAGTQSVRTAVTASSQKTKESSHKVIAGTTTTLMIRNIPLRFTPVSFREVIDAEGFSGKYDYCYMPMDFRSHRSLGYCFINFYSVDAAADFASLFANRRFTTTNSDKVLAISAGARQGLLPNVASFKLSTLRQMPRTEFRPVVAILGQLFPLDEEVYTLLLSGRASA